MKIPVILFLLKLYARINIFKTSKVIRFLMKSIDKGTEIVIDNRFTEFGFEPMCMDSMCAANCVVASHW